MQFQVTIDQISQFAATFWDLVKGSKVFAFHGPMGSGKTTLIEALCAAKGVLDRMSSPTFSIINEYAFIQDDREELIYHLDLYRLKDEEEIIQAGVEDCIYSGNICMVEWPEKAPHLFDEHAVHVYLESTGPASRSIKIELPSPRLKEQS